MVVGCENTEGKVQIGETCMGARFLLLLTVGDGFGFAGTSTGCIGNVSGMTMGYNRG